MNTSFYNGISGVKTQQFGIDVIGNNIANIALIGFKGKSPEFATLFATTLTDSYFEPTSNTIGSGSKANTAALDLSQGVFQSTDSVFDLALGGEGWFGVQGAGDQTLYTRAGAFSIDADGYLVDGSGNYLLGTSGDNITPTTLSQSVMEDFGRYYGADSRTLGTAYAATDVNDITLSAVDSQSKIQLQDILYFPPIPSTNVFYQANLDPQLTTTPASLDINAADIQDTINSIDKTISINGTVANTPLITNATVGESVIVTITDINGAKVITNAALDSNLNWVIADEDISTLDYTNALSVTASLDTVEQVANVEHFTSPIISPTGDKDIIDMTYTKRIPQPTEGSTWDGVIQVLSFYETYNPDSIYDPALYKVDQNAGKVYEIVDSKVAVVSFDGSGQLVSADIPTMSNSGTPLTINVGEPNTFTGFVSNVNLDKARVYYEDPDAPGIAAGLLKAYGMDGNGNVVAEFDNGQSVPVSKVAVYHFQNDQGLTNLSSTYFATSVNSGAPIFYTDANGTPILGAQILPNNLEGSNVQMTTALTELIIMQKAFDASAKSITTSDQMIQNAINMKK